MTTPHELPPKWRDEAENAPGMTGGARAARRVCADELEADLARSGAEAVAWQRRYKHLLPDGSHADWHGVTRAKYESERARGLNDPHYEWRCLYTAPPASAGVPECVIREVLKLLDNVTASTDTEADYLGQAENMLDQLLSAPQPSEVVTIADIQPPAIDDPKVLETTEQPTQPLEQRARDERTQVLPGMIAIPVAAAVKTDDGVIHFMPAPHRHHHTVHALNAVNKPAESPIILATGNQGFVMSDGTFATREDAGRAAIKAGLIPALRWPPKLYSEDLW